MLDKIFDNLINPEVVCKNPNGLMRADASKIITQHHKRSLDLFNSLIESGICREQARGVLPQNMYTEYYGTVNLSNLLKFIELRTHEGAQWEIQKVASACLEIATDLWPITSKAYRETKRG